MNTHSRVWPVVAVLMLSLCFLIANYLRAGERIAVGVDRSGILAPDHGVFRTLGTLYRR